MNWKKDRFTATINGVLNEGTARTVRRWQPSGVDPRTCSAQSDRYSWSTDQRTALRELPVLCWYSSAVTSGYLAIPNPQTLRLKAWRDFANRGSSISACSSATMATPRIHLSATSGEHREYVLRRIFREPWTAAYKPNSIVCSYAPNGYNYIGNRNRAPGSSSAPRDTASQTAQQGYPNVFNQSYQPLYGAIPFQVYFNAQVRL